MGFAEKMIEQGEKLDADGKKTSSAGCSIMGFVLCLIVLAVLAFAAYACGVL